MNEEHEFGAGIWGDYEPQPAAWLNSLMAHILVLAAIVVPFTAQRALGPATVPDSLRHISIYLPLLPGVASESRGGGSGGDRSRTPASQGRIPRFTEMQLAPPEAVPANLAPQLSVEATLIGPPELRVPPMNLNAPWGDPTGVVGLRSNGPGGPAGIGDNEGTGIGSDRGPGFGPGPGEGVLNVGGNVLAPVPTYKPEPLYTEEARKAKYQGTVILWIVVDALGKVADVRVAKPLGMGLDEAAINTVRTWKFTPGKRNGAPVPVRVVVEISFRLF